ncbi:MAG: DUF1285 domain-containing protein [Maricaulaceae bacterium]|nr:DUF1285 domain-containing protein [Maricaulaceae bacterium]
MQSLLAAAEAAGDGLPPVEKWNPQHCGVMDIAIRRDGSWWHEGRRITRRRLVKLFSRILRKEDDGLHYLVTPVEKVAVKVECAPFIAVRVDRAGEGRAQQLVFTTNLDDLTIAGPDRPIRVETDPQTGEPAPFVRVRAALDALIARPAFYELVEMAEERDGVLGVWSSGVFFELGPAR